MARTIFKNQTADAEVTTLAGNDIFANGVLQVDVSGVLDGADFKTFYFGADNAKVDIAACSWLAAFGEIPGGADGGTRLINNREIGFSIENAGVNTDISVDFDVR